MGARTAKPAAIFRRLGTNERGKLVQHFLRLRADDRRLRFGGHTSDERIQAYGAQLNRHCSVVLGCFIAGELRAVGELKRIPGTWPRAAELAVSVEAPFRGMGFGTELCRRLIVRARNRFIATLHMLCLLDNEPVQRIARRLGSSLTFHPGEVEAQFEAPWPDPISASEEWLEETNALLGLGPLLHEDTRPWWTTSAPPHSPVRGEER